jgi:hypothetical protein
MLEPKVSYSYGDLDDDVLLDIMVEGRSISTRRSASIEYKKRVVARNAELKKYKTKLIYYVEKEKRRISRPSSIADSQHVYVIRVSSTQVVVYHKNEDIIHLSDLAAVSQYRLDLMLMLGVITKFGSSATIYIDSEYVNETIRFNLDRWQENGYITKEGKEVRNKDILVKLVAVGLSMGRVVSLLPMYHKLCEHVKEVMSTQ